MSDHEPVIHCPPSNEPHTGNYILLPELQISQSTLDGLYALMYWCDGFTDAGKGRVPGAWELAMFYRGIRGKGKLVDVNKNLAIQARIGRACMAGWHFKDFNTPGFLNNKPMGTASITVVTPDGVEVKHELQWPRDNEEWLEALLNMAGVPS